MTHSENDEKEEKKKIENKRKRRNGNIFEDGNGVFDKRLECYKLYSIYA